jgi:hypothetical protein
MLAMPGIGGNNGGNGGNGGNIRKKVWHGRGGGFLTDEDIEHLPKGDEAIKIFRTIGNQKSINNDTFHSLLYYSIFGHIFKDVVQTFWGKKNTGMRHFLGLVGPTTTGKSRALDNALVLLSQFQKRLIHNGIDPIRAGINPNTLSGGSPERIGHTLQRLGGNVYFCTEEFGKFLDHGGKKYMKGFDELMIQAIDGKPIKNETFNNPFYISHPQLSYAWATTVEKFVAHNMISSYTGGWMARGVVYYHEVDQKTSRMNELTMENTPMYNMNPLREELVKAMTAEGTISRNLDYLMKWAGIDTIMSRLTEIMYIFGSRDHLVDGFKSTTLEFTRGRIQSYKRIINKVNKKTGAVEKVEQYEPIAVEESVLLPYKHLFTIDNNILRKDCELLLKVFDSTVTLFFSSEYNEQIERFLHELKRHEGLLSEEELLNRTNWIADKDYTHLVRTLLKRGEIIPVITKGTKGFYRNYFCDHQTREKEKKCGPGCPIYQLCPGGSGGVVTKGN